MKFSLTVILSFLFWTVTAEFSRPNYAHYSPRLEPADQPSKNSSDTQVICQPFGTCEPCPGDELKQAFCQPFGNRQLLHCRSADSVGTTPTWGPCGRIIMKERADFLEFTACNVVFTVVGILVIIGRSRRLAYERSRALAARIGISRV